MKSKNSQEGKKVKDPYIFWLILLSIIIVITTASYGLIMYNAFGRFNSDSASFGDMYGALNTLFSGLAFGGIVISIILQRRDLQETIKEMQNSSDALNSQLKTMELSTKIEVLNKFLSLNHQGRESEEYLMAKKIIEYSTREFLLSNEHAHLTQPKMSIRVAGINKGSEAIISNNETTIELYNEGFKTSNDWFKTTIPIELGPRGKLNEGANRLLVTIPEGNTRFSWLIYFKGQLNQTSWEQKLIISPIGDNKRYISISTPSSLDEKNIQKVWGLEETK